MTIVINGIVIYLLTPGVKAAFGVEGDLQSAVMTGLPMGGGAAAAAPPPAAPAEPAAPGGAGCPGSTGWLGTTAGEHQGRLQRVVRRHGGG